MVKRLWWNVRYAYTMWLQTRPTFKFLWGAAVAADDCYNEGDSPKDAVEAELEHWTW